jgi:AcrR family transcriptional regulator
VAKPHPRDEPSKGAEERIVETAYDLFSRRGVRDVGVDELIEQAGVAKATFYRHFHSKDDLVIAFLERREERWTREWIDKEARKRGATPEESLLAIFDLLDEWFRHSDFEGGAFMRTLLEMGRQHPAGQASVRHLNNMRGMVRQLAEEAGLRDPGTFALSWHILIQGSIVVAAEGDAEAAARAKNLARLLIEQHR